jgi:1,4-dihydroxy-2-naphthoyl-CoA hydrolase
VATPAFSDSLAGMASESASPAERDGFSGLIGVEYGELGPERAEGRVAVRPELCQPYGVLHGGVFAALAESICSSATWHAVRDDGKVAFGQSNSTTFLRTIADGHVNAVAEPRQRGRTTWVWDTDLTDDDGALCALVRMVVAVRPRRD